MGSFEHNIKRWVSLDNRIKALNEEVKALRDERTDLTNDISIHIEENKLENATIKISDGKLRYVTTKASQPISLKYVETCLSQCISDPVKVKALVDHIKQNREVKETTELKRYYDKREKEEEVEED